MAHRYLAPHADMRTCFQKRRAALMHIPAGQFEFLALAVFASALAFTIGTVVGVI